MLPVQKVRPISRSGGKHLEARVGKRSPDGTPKMPMDVGLTDADNCCKESAIPTISSSAPETELEHVDVKPVIVFSTKEQMAHRRNKTQTQHVEPFKVKPIIFHDARHRDKTAAGDCDVQSSSSSHEPQEKVKASADNEEETVEVNVEQDGNSVSSGIAKNLDSNPAKPQPVTAQVRQDEKKKPSPSEMIKNLEPGQQFTTVVAKGAHKATAICIRPTLTGNSELFLEPEPSEKIKYWLRLCQLHGKKHDFDVHLPRPQDIVVIMTRTGDSTRSFDIVMSYATKFGIAHYFRNDAETGRKWIPLEYKPIQSSPAAASLRPSGKTRHSAEKLKDYAVQCDSCTTPLLADPSEEIGTDKSAAAEPVANNSCKNRSKHEVQAQARDNLCDPEDRERDDLMEYLIDHLNPSSWVHEKVRSVGFGKPRREMSRDKAQREKRVWSRGSRRPSSYRGSNRPLTSRGNNRLSSSRGSSRPSSCRGTNRSLSRETKRPSTSRESNRRSTSRGSNRPSIYRGSSRQLLPRGSRRPSFMGGNRPSSRGSNRPPTSRGSRRPSSYRGRGRLSTSRGSNRPSSSRGSHRSIHTSRRHHSPTPEELPEYQPSHWSQPWQQPPAFQSPPRYTAGDHSSPHWLPQPEFPTSYAPTQAPMPCQGPSSSFTMSGPPAIQGMAVDSFVHIEFQQMQYTQTPTDHPMAHYNQSNAQWQSNVAYSNTGRPQFPSDQPMEAYAMTTGGHDESYGAYPNVTCHTPTNFYQEGMESYGAERFETNAVYEGNRYQNARGVRRTYGRRHGANVANHVPPKRKCGWDKKRNERFQQLNTQGRKRNRK